MEAKRWNLRKNSKEMLEIKEMKNVFDWLVSRLAKERLCHPLKNVGKFFLQKADGRHFKLSGPRGKIKDIL